MTRRYPGCFFQAYQNEFQTIAGSKEGGVLNPDGYGNLSRPTMPNPEFTVICKQSKTKAVSKWGEAMIYQRLLS
jgi:hypothetical protein